VVEAAFPVFLWLPDCIGGVLYYSLPGFPVETVVSDAHTTTCTSGP
jgi:hypothetical protein